MIDVERLKQKILDLAIRGQLVPQDPNDEPASVLIEKIRAEKEALVKQGKIKRDKNESYIFKGDDNSYYEKYITLGEALRYIQPQKYIVNSTNYNDKYKIPVLTPGKSFILGYTNDEHGVYDATIDNVIIFDDFTTATKFVDFKFKVKSSALKILVSSDSRKYCVKYFYYLLNVIKTPVDAHKRFWISKYHSHRVSVPPIWYQYLVVDYLDVIFYNLQQIEKNQSKLFGHINILKYKILDLFFGADSRYMSYYENEQKLGDILEYEQPAKYIVNSTEYSDNFTTPVLTPGKTFILGYTNEKDGIYKVNGDKVIIFDDFTTASRLVDFDFKVKSSAMKILTVSDKNLYDVEYMYLFLQTIHVNSNTHKRYWLSDFATHRVKIHTIQEQKKIVQEIKRMCSIIKRIEHP